MYFGWSPETAYEKWTDDARSTDPVKKHKYFKTIWHNSTYYVYKFDEMFTVLSRSVVKDIVSKPLCPKKQRWQRKRAKRRSNDVFCVSFGTAFQNPETSFFFVFGKLSFMPEFS